MSDRLAETAGLYVHVPFCRRICPYCDFAVRTGDAARKRRFVEHLLAEIDLRADWPYPVDTIYFGGGTPSALEPEDLARIVERLRTTFAVSPDARIYLEANPEDLTAETVTAWRRLGVSTLSLGVQALDAAALRFLGRQHEPETARLATELALEAGFPTVSIDLIYARPGQDVAGWLRELDEALSLGIQHLSCYELTIHERTRFGLLRARGKLEESPEQRRAELFRATHEHLEAAGFTGYEVSNFAAGPEHRSRHNEKYWTHAPYLGLGPSAHSFCDRRRFWNVRSTDPWQQRIAAGELAVEAEEHLDDRTLALETLMLGFRTRAGVDLARLRRFGVDLPGSHRAVVTRLAAEGLAAMDGGRLVPTLDGLAVADSLPLLFSSCLRSQTRGRPQEADRLAQP